MLLALVFGLLTRLRLAPLLFGFGGGFFHGQALLLQALGFGARFRLLGFALSVQLLLLLARLLLEHVPLHVGALASHLHIDGT